MCSSFARSGIANPHAPLWNPSGTSPWTVRRSRCVTPFLSTEPLTETREHNKGTERRPRSEWQMLGSVGLRLNWYSSECHQKRLAHLVGVTSERVSRRAEPSRAAARVWRGGLYCLRCGWHHSTPMAKRTRPAVQGRARSTWRGGMVGKN